MREMVSSTLLLFLIIDPLGNLPIFMSILKHLKPHRQRIIIMREMIIALILMLIFLFAGDNILSFLSLRTETVSISGGVILFVMAMKMIFPNIYRENNSFSSSKEDEPFLVPLAIPLIAGPSIMAALLLLSHQHQQQFNYLLLSLFIAWLLSLIILLLSNVFLLLLGNKGVSALERLMGLLLVMISIQMFLNGIRAYFG